jgi:hypothetical protein
VPSTSINFNALSIITDALVDLGVCRPGATLSASDGELGLRVLNNFIGALSTQRLSFPFTDREVFAVVANQGTYTIGPGGNFSTVRPMNITGAGRLYPATSATVGPLEVRVDVLTDDAYDAIAFKSMRSAQWTSVHYTPTVTGGLGTVELWPVPDTAVNSLVLYRGDAIQGFANLTTFYDFPPGYYEMLQFNIEKRLCRSYGLAREWGALDDALASESLRLVKRQNFRLVDAALDGTLGGGRYYDIYEGNG